MKRFALALLLTLTATPALAADNRVIHKSRVDHSIAAARAAFVRLDYHADRYCVDRCARYEMDLIIADRAMKIIEGYADRALRNEPLGAVDVNRIQHQVFAADRALDRLEYYAKRVDEKHRLRVTIDVDIMDRAMKILSHYARNAPKA